jgi:predicted RNA binding protein YcfA (HicA-like mRNA interferase family)
VSKIPTVPHHAGRDLARPLIRSILRDIDLTPDDHLRVLEQL